MSKTNKQKQASLFHMLLVWSHSVVTADKDCWSPKGRRHQQVQRRHGNGPGSHWYSTAAAPFRVILYSSGDPRKPLGEAADTGEGNPGRFWRWRQREECPCSQLELPMWSTSLEASRQAGSLPWEGDLQTHAAAESGMQPGAFSSFFQGQMFFPPSCQIFGLF